MSENKHFVFNEYDNYKGQLVIYDTEIVHFLGIGEDNHDYFYVLVNKNGKMILGTPVAAIISLKERLSEKDYNILKYPFSKNCYYSNNNFYITQTSLPFQTALSIRDNVRKQIVGLCTRGGDKLVTELIFDID